MFNPYQWGGGVGALLLLSATLQATEANPASDGPDGRPLVQKDRPFGPPGFPKWDGRSGSYDRPGRTDGPKQDPKAADAPRDPRQPQPPGPLRGDDRRG